MKTFDEWKRATEEMRRQLRDELAACHHDRQALADRIIGLRAQLAELGEMAPEDPSEAPVAMVREALRKRPGQLRTDLVEVTGLDYVKVSSALQNLRKQGEVVTAGPRKKYRYSLKADPRQVDIEDVIGRPAEAE